MNRLWLVIFIASAVSVSAVANEIHQAIDRGDSAATLAILQQHPDYLNARDSLDMTPLNIAAFKGHLSLARLLLDRGADMSIGDKDSSLPIHNASVAGHTAVVEFLVAKGTNIDAQDRNGTTPLLFAMVYRKPETARWLTEHGANVNLANSQLATPLQCAALTGNRELAQLLVERGAKLEVANNYGRTPLLLVARETGDSAMAAFLLDHGADVNALDRFHDTPLSLAAWRGFRSLCDLFLDHGAMLPSTAESRKELISQCAQRGLVRLFKALTDSTDIASDKNGSGGTLLHEAAIGGSGELCALLIGRGLGVADRDCWGRTPLHYAAERGRTEVCSLLVAHGADPDVHSLAGYTPLSLALEFKEDTTAALLRKLGAKLEQPTFPVLRGPYFGQKLPGVSPVQFAPDIVSSSRFKHGCITFPPDGLEAFWSSEYQFNDAGYSTGGILTSRIENGQWTVPRLADFSSVSNNDDVPFFSPDGKRLYFLSSRPDQPGGRSTAERIWYVERTADGWSQPHLITGGPNKHGLHWQFAVAANGNIYFHSSDPRGVGREDIWISKYQGGVWLEPVNLGSTVNSAAMEMCPYIAPDESYLILVTLDTSGSSDTYLKISFHKPDGSWTQARPLESPQGQPIVGVCPIVSPDSKTLFVNSTLGGLMDARWLDATVIETMRKEMLK